MWVSYYRIRNDVANHYLTECLFLDVNDPGTINCESLAFSRSRLHYS